MLICLFLTLVGAVNVPTPPFISSVTASGDFGTPNHMLQFDPKNVSHIYSDISYEFYEDTIAREYDPATQRWFLLLEQADVVVYDALNLTYIGQIPLSQFSIQIPEGMHYDPQTNMLWFVYLASEGSTGQYCGLSVAPQAKEDKKLVQQPSCYSFSGGDYSYLIDASAFDVSTGMIWTQLPSMKSGQFLLGFNVRTQQVSSPVPMDELCQDMRVAVLNKTSALICVRFVTNDIVSVDTKTGRCTRLIQLPPFQDPIHTTAIAVPSADKTTSSLFVQLQGLVTYDWVEFDLLSGKMLQNTSTLINKHLPLAMTIYVSK